MYRKLLHNRGYTESNLILTKHSSPRASTWKESTWKEREEVGMRVVSRNQRRADTHQFFAPLGGQLARLFCLLTRHQRQKDLGCSPLQTHKQENKSIDACSHAGSHAGRKTGRKTGRQHIHTHVYTDKHAHSRTSTHANTGRPFE